MKSLERLYFENNKSCLLLVNKKLSRDNSFKGDFNLNNKIISKDIKNDFIYTGLQLINRNVFDLIDKKIFSMNEVWDKLITENNLLGFESAQNFYHINTKEMYKKILESNVID